MVGKVVCVPGIFRKQISVCLQADNDFYEGIRAGMNCSATFPLI